MEARVVHLQLLVALTAQRLWALNLHTEKHKQAHICQSDDVFHLLQLYSVASHFIAALDGYS